MRLDIDPDHWLRGRWNVRAIPDGGAMGDVYIVYDKVWGGLVAAKSFKRRLFAGRAALEPRFIKEAANWIRLDFHPNVTAALYMDRFDERPFLFLEYVPGGDLARWIRTSRRADDLAPVLRFAANICDGMSHILANGIQAHRDLKPANCLLAGDGTLKISDFGLVRAFDDEPLPSGQEGGAGGPGPGTGTGVGLGTWPYMPPEQFVDAKRADVRSDIYSFGIMLHEMVTGQRPFVARRNEKEEYEYLHLTASPPAISRHPELSALIARCLAKSPTDRFSDFAAVRRELEAVARGGLPSPPSAAHAPRLPQGKKLVQLADSLNVLLQQDEALVCCEQALALDANDAWALTVKGKCLAALGRPTEALSCLERAAQLDPSSDDTWRILGGLLSALKRPGDAVAAYDRALALSPDREEVWTMRGHELAGLERDREALKSYEQALALDDRSTMAWLGRAAILAQLGRRQEALAAVELLLERDPSHPQGLQLRAMLSR